MSHLHPPSSRSDSKSRCRSGFFGVRTAKMEVVRMGVDVCDRNSQVLDRKLG